MGLGKNSMTKTYKRIVLCVDKPARNGSNLLHKTFLYVRIYFTLIRWFVHGQPRGKVSVGNLFTNSGWNLSFMLYFSVLNRLVSVVSIRSLAQYLKYLNNNPVYTIFMHSPLYLPETCSATLVLFMVIHETPCRVHYLNHSDHVALLLRAPSFSLKIEESSC